VNKVEVDYCVCDLSTDKGIQKLIDHVINTKLEVDILINNAGASVHENFIDLDPDKVDQLVTLNLVSYTRLCRAIIPQMVQRKNGRVLNIGSLASSCPCPSSAIYGASKAYILSLTLALTYELRHTGVTATCYCPGPVQTNFAKWADVEKSVFMNIPGVGTEAKECAKGAIDALFNAKEVEFDAKITRVFSFLLGHLMPTRLQSMIGAVVWGEPSQILENIR
jgi:short-subunit dehydrogenase